MENVYSEIQIDLPKALVWQAWSTFFNVADYVPTILKSYSIGTIITGPGAIRRCVIKKDMQVEERITNWVPEEQFSFEVIKTMGVPMKKLEAVMSLKNVGSFTLAKMSVSYQMKGVLRFLPTNSMMLNQTKNHLIGLKHYLETDEIVTPSKLKVIRLSYRSSLK